MSIPVKLQDLLENGAIFELDLNKCKEANEDDDVAVQEVVEAMHNFPNFNCEGQFDELFDEDVYVEGQPFEIIATKMTDVCDDGGVKKRVLREGYGNTPPNLALVKIHYNAYVEYEATPYDSTYARKRPQKYVINNGEVLPGLDIAVQSMKVSEKSQFLISPNYAFGSLGCLGRIPANATLLFEVELIEIIDSGATLTYSDLPEEEQKKFERTYKYCEALCAKGKDMFKQNNIRGAIREYNTAVGRLETAQLDNYDEQEQQSEMLERLYTNLLVCYTKENEPKKALTNYNKIKGLLKETNKKPTSKMLYNSSKCYKMLSEYKLARNTLNEARKLDPKNVDIAKEFIVLEKEIEAYHKKEREIAQAVMGKKKST